MNKFIKIISTILVIMLIISSSNIIQVCAWGVNSISEPTDPSGGREKDVKGIMGKILGIINTIGTILSVVILIIIGIKYMLGSVEEKAAYKKTLMPYAVGAGLLFAAPTIANMIYIFVKDIK